MKRILYRESSALKRWWNRQLTEYTIAGVEVEFLRIRWWPLLILLGIIVHDALWIAGVAMSDVAANSSPDSLWLPKLLSQ